jgi:hypothetical protein
MCLLDIIFFTSPLEEWRMAMHGFLPPKQPGQPMPPAIHPSMLLQLEGIWARVVLRV